MLSIPYALSDFYALRTEGYCYIDRTHLLPQLEQAGRQLLFLRPRRFGKTLWLSLLENYYDVAKAAAFESLFAELAIGEQPTPHHNRYFILRWDFSVVDPQGDREQIARSLHNHINATIEAFNYRYHSHLPAPIPLNPDDGIHTFQRLIAQLPQLGYPLYLLIDEYDNFANELLTSRQQGRQRYDELVAGEGVIKTVFKAVKAAASGQGLERVFITGVSPVVMSDITSGYNVVKNISQWPEFAPMCGFTGEEVATINRQIAQQHDTPPAAVDTICATMNSIMRDYYNGYRFTLEQSERLYNPTLCLYFWDEWQRRRRPPLQLLDANLAMDRNRIRYIAALPHGSQVVEQVLEPEQPLSIAALATEFGVEAMLNDPPDATFILSLLLYFGVLTIDSVDAFGEIQLTIPNQVIRSLYIDRLQQQLLNGYEDNNQRQAVAEQLYSEANMTPLADFIEQRFYTALDNRDQRWSNELTLKMTLLILLTNDLYYLPRSELSLGNGYSDLLFEVRPDKRNAPLFDLLFELKYLPLNALKLSGDELAATPREALVNHPVVAAALDSAEAQLTRYQTALQQRYPAIAWRLAPFAMVTLGTRRLVWRQPTR